MGSWALIAIIAAVPILAMAVEWFGDVGITERHHSHHDTYLIPRSISSALMLMMLFVSMLGLAVGWLCSVGVFTADVIAVHSFFASFLVVACAMWLGVRRYRVVTFDDRLQVRPFVGPSRSLKYASITRIRWKRHLFSNNYRSLQVISNDKSLLLWGMLDLEQILVRINRFDVLEGLDGTV